MIKTDINTQFEAERNAMKTDPEFNYAVKVWNQRAAARAKITMLESEITAVQERCNRYMGELKTLAVAVKPENKHLIFWL